MVIIIYNEDEETFYAEWVYDDIETESMKNDDWNEVEKQDVQHAIEAYSAYINGETEYII